MKKLALLLFLAFFGLIQAQAQINVSGTIVDDQCVPLPGANVLVQGTTTGKQIEISQPVCLKF